MNYRTHEAHLICEHLTLEEMKRLGVTRQGWRYYKDRRRVEIRAVVSGKVRAPRAGERYLSGAIPEAYLCRADLSTEHQLVTLITVVMVKHWKEV